MTKLYVITNIKTGEDGRPFALCARCFDLWDAKDRVVWRILGDSTSSPCRECGGEVRAIEPSATESMLNVIAAFEETEEYYELAGDVVMNARTWLSAKQELSTAYRNGHKVTSDTCQKLRANMNLMEDNLDKAIETLERWLKSKGHDLEEIATNLPLPR